MTKGIAIKAGIILGFFGLVLGLAFGCSSVRDNQDTPQIDNGSGTYLTVDGITITNQELWEKMRITDGLTYLEQYIDEQLLSDYIALVTQDLIDEKVEETIYGTNDPDAIAKIREDAEREDELILNYERSLILQGLDPNNADDVRSFFELQIAKELYTVDFIEGLTDESDTLHISEGDVEAHYVSSVRGDVCAIVVRFYSYDEATAVFDEFDIVPNYEGRIGRYFDETTPIEDVLTSQFDEENTSIMTDQEALKAFIQMYNYMYDAGLDEELSIETFCATAGDEFQYDYDAITGQFDSTSAEQTFAGYLWDTIDLEDDDTEDEEIPLRFSITPRAIDDYQLMVYKVSQETVTEYDDLTQAEKDDLYNELLEEKVTTSSITRAMAVLWDDIDFEIFDPILKLQYEFTEQVEFDNRGDDVIIATFNNEEITAQELFEYMNDQIGPYYVLEMIKQKSLLASDYYVELYGDDYDYINNRSEKMIEHRDELREMKSMFSSNQYANYGFSSSAYTWEEFLILAFNNESEANVIRDLFVIGGMQPNHVKDLIAYENAADFIQAQIDEYFNLNVTHLLLYLDNDFNFEPDSYNDYVDSLSGDALTEYNSLVVAFENLVISKINNDEYTLAEIVEEYKDSLVQDPDNDWADFKEYGFFIMTENLSAQGSLTNNNTNNYDEDFVTALKRIYDSYVVALEADDTLSRYVDNQLVQSDFGMHFIIATEGSKFEQPSAEFDVTDTNYNEGFANDSMVPTQEQVELYIEIKLAERLNQAAPYTIPTSVKDALVAYYDPILSAYFNTGGYTIASAEYALANDISFTSDEAEMLAFLQTVIDVLYEVNFPDEFLTPAELAE
jgi:hypothetical protein